MKAENLVRFSKSINSFGLELVHPTKSAARQEFSTFEGLRSVAVISTYINEMGLMEQLKFISTCLENRLLCLYCRHRKRVPN